MAVEFTACVDWAVVLAPTEPLFRYRYAPAVADQTGGAVVAEVDAQKFFMSILTLRVMAANSAPVPDTRLIMPRLPSA